MKLSQETCLKIYKGGEHSLSKNCWVTISLVIGMVKQKMDKKKIVFTYLFLSMFALTGCNKNQKVDGSYDFIIYESDLDNSNLFDNIVLVKFHIEYTGCKTVTDTLIKKGSIYFFSETSPDYLVLKNSTYGLSYSEGYFEEYLGCSKGEQIDISWSYTTVNGVAAAYGIGETPLEGLKEYGFVINGWKTN